MSLSLSERVARMERHIHEGKRERQWIASIPSMHASIIRLNRTMQQGRLFPRRVTPPLHNGTPQHLLHVERRFEEMRARVHNLETQMEEFQCCLCMAAKRDTCLLPCRHASFCRTCVDKVLATVAPTCPVCRVPVQSSLNLK